MASADEIKAKYSSALDSMSQEGIQETQMRMQDGKLYVLAFAPSQDAKNRVWDKIKQIDSSYSDLTLDIRIGTPQSEFNNTSAQSLATGLAGAFQSDQGSPFGGMLSGLFGHSDPQQKAGLLNQILGAAGPGLLASALPGPLAGILQGGGRVSPEQAQQISPQAVQDLAAHAQRSNPSVVDNISGFYSEHPKVVQALGAGALAMVLSHMKKN